MNRRMRKSAARRLPGCLLLAAVLAAALAAPLAGRAIDFQSTDEAKASALTPEYLSQQREANETRDKLKTTDALPPVATPPGCTITEISCGILWILNLVVDFLITIIFPIGQSLFETMLSYSFDFANEGSQFAVAMVGGWKIVLGVVNMFFVLLLLWIAIATIFDFEMFSLRKTLAHVIIAALLINFSLPIGRAIINLSNGIAGIFLAQINEGLGGVTPAIQQIFDPTALSLVIQNQYVNMSPEKAKRILAESRTTVDNDRGPFGIRRSKVYTAKECEEVVRAADYFRRGTDSPAYRQCSALIADVKVAKALTATRDPKQFKTQLLAGALVAKVFVAPVALFVIFAASAMLLMRIIMLILLLVGGPIAFFSFAMPGLGGQAQQWGWSAWWSNLFKWSLYLPAFLFLFMLSLVVLQSIPPATLKLIIAGETVPDFTKLMINYLIGLGMMIAALMAGRWMGIMGAGAIIGVGSGVATAAGKWTKGTGKALGGGLAGMALGSTVGQRLASSRYTRWALRPVEAAQAAGQRVRDERERAALQRRGLAAKVSPDYRWALAQGMAPSERADFIRQSKPHELRSMLNVMSPEQRINLHNEMRSFDLDEKLVDAVKNLTAALEMESGVARTDARFQPAFNNWLQGAPEGELQKRISAEDIRTDTNLHTAIASSGIVGLPELKTLAHTGEKADALRQHLIDLGGRENFESETALGYGEVEASERAIRMRAIPKLQATNPGLANDLAALPAMQFNIARGRPLSRKTGPAVIVVPPAGGTP